MTTKKKFFSFINLLPYLLGILIFLIASYILDQPDTPERFEYDFRGTKWGMSSKIVKAIETSELIEDDKDTYTQVLDYRTNKDQYLVDIRYLFILDKLQSGSYYFNIEDDNIDQYMQDYTKLKEEIIHKYGKPIEKINNLEIESNQAELLLTKWKTYSTEISLELIGANNKYGIFLRYKRSKDNSFSEQEFSFY